MKEKLKQKINSLIGNASGYMGIIIISVIIIVLVVGLMYVQRNWVSREKKELKSMIEKQSIGKKL